MMKQQVTKLIIRCAILLVATVLCDRIVGTGLEYLYYQQTHGDDYTTLYALTKADDNILIFGTSRASHHYNARLIGEQTGASCFNAGRDEMEIPYSKDLMRAIFKRHVPELVLLDIGPMELSGEKEVVYQRIATAFMPYADKYPMFDSAISKAGEMELWKLKASKIYAFNSKLGSMIQNAYTQLGHLSDMGYEPLYKTIDTSIYKESIWDDIDKDLPLSADYVNTLQDIIKLTAEHNVKLAIGISPFYFQHDFSNNKSYSTIKRIASETGVELLDFSNDPEFTQHPMLFQDDIHLNDTGAAIYTRKVVDLLIERGIIAGNN